MIITIQKSDFHRAQRFLCASCVVTKALQRVFDSRIVCYLGPNIRVYDKIFADVLPQEALDIASDFDIQKDVVNRSFEITESNAAKIRTAITSYNKRV